MIFMIIRTKDKQSIFLKKSAYATYTAHTASRYSLKILLEYTDTVLGRRYTIGIQCFSTDLLWH